MSRVYETSVRTNLEDDELEDKKETVNKTSLIKKVFLSKSPAKPWGSILISPQPIKTLSLLDLYNEWIYGDSLKMTSKCRRNSRYRNPQQIESTVTQDNNSTVHSNKVTSQNTNCTSDQVINMTAEPSSSIGNTSEDITQHKTYCVKVHSYSKPPELRDLVSKQPPPRKRSRKSGKLPLKRISAKQRKTESFDNSSLELTQELQQMEPLDLRMPHKKLEELSCTTVDVSWANCSTNIIRQDNKVIYPTSISGNNTTVSPKTGGSNYGQINVGVNDTLQQYTDLGSSSNPLNFLSGISHNYKEVDPIIVTAKNATANPSAFEFNYQPANVEVNNTFNYLQQFLNPFPAVPQKQKVRTSNILQQKTNSECSQNFVYSLSGIPNSVTTENNAPSYSTKLNCAPVKVKESYAFKQQSNPEYPLYYNPIYNITQNHQSSSIGFTTNGFNCTAVNTEISDAFKQQPSLIYLPYFANSFPEAYQNYTAQNNNSRNITITSYEGHATRNVNILKRVLEMLKAYPNSNGKEEVKSKSELPECNGNNSQLQECTIQNEVTESVALQRQGSPEEFTSIRERFPEQPVSVYFNKRKYIK